MSFTIKPTVDQSREFLEIAGDFSNPLDIVREAISNSFDAGASRMTILFESTNYEGEFELKITLKDNGHGMNESELHNFFDLGNSSRRGDPSKIGEKGHGTKVYFNCKGRIVVTTIKDGVKYVATMNKPKSALFNNKIPEVQVDTAQTTEQTGTSIEIYGYNENRTDHFAHLEVKDYIYWFTKFGSIEKEFGILDNKDVKLELKGIDKAQPEELSFGHIFPQENSNLNQLFDRYLEQAPNWYCKRKTKSGSLPGYPQYHYDMVFYIEGSYVKYAYNELIRRKGRARIPGDYTVQQRYGLYLCKDYIPIALKNEWINKKGSESTKIHAFINSQDLRLTANRGSVENTPTYILEALQKVVEAFFDEITCSSDWQDMDLLDSMVVGEKTVKKERSDFDNRIKNVNRSKICKYLDSKTNRVFTLHEPINENGVYALFMQTTMIDETLFPFSIVDYNTHEGIDVIVVDNRRNLPINQTNAYYVEFKNDLTKAFNHGFSNLHSIICWKLGSGVQDGEEIKDVTGTTRKLEKTLPNPNIPGDYTRYYLNDPRSSHKIEVFVLSEYLVEKMNIQFKNRNPEDFVVR